MFFLFYACFTLVLPWGNLWDIKSFSSRFFGCQIVNTLVILPFSYNQLITSNGQICPCFLTCQIRHFKSSAIWSLRGNRYVGGNCSPQFCVDVQNHKVTHLVVKDGNSPYLTTNPHRDSFGGFPERLCHFWQSENRPPITNPAARIDGWGILGCTRIPQH